MTERDPVKRPSRRGWPLRTGPTTTSAGTHDHPLPAWVSAAFIGLTVTVLVLIGVVALIVHRNGQLTAFRDEQQAETHKEMRRGFCDLLDQFPPSPLLDGPRKRYGCGPGIPMDQLPPAIRQRRPSPPTAPAAAPTTPARPAPSSAVAAPTTGRAGPDPTTGAPTDRPPPAGVPAPTRSDAPPTSPPPLDPLLCRLLNVCVDVSTS